MVKSAAAPQGHEELLERARTLKKQVIVAENYRFFPAERTVKKLLDESFLGAVDNATLIDRRHMPSHTEGPWLASIDYPHLQEVAIHHFDSLRACRIEVIAHPFADHHLFSPADLDFGDGLPVGAQLLGPAHSEPLLISLAAQLESDQRWYEQRAPAAVGQ